MANKLITTKETYKQMATEITKTPEEWLKFLDTCSNNYKFSFVDQVLIYAQKPDATYLAKIEDWNKLLHRWIKKDIKGVALLENDGTREYLKYVFDIADTYDKFGRNVSVWRLNHNFNNEIIEDLENTFGKLEMKSNLSEAIISASYNMVEDNFQDYFSELKLSTENSFLEDLDDDTINYYFRKIMSNSVAYMIMKRCGLNPKDYFSVEDFREITNFNTIQSVSKLGMATSDIAENGLKEIYETNKDLTKNSKNKNYTFVNHQKQNYNKDNENDIGKQMQEVANDFNLKEIIEKQENNERSKEYGNNISQRGRLSDTRPSGRETGESESRNVWQSKNEILDGTQERNLGRNDDVRNSNETSSGDRPNSEFKSERDSSGTSRTESSERTNEKERSSTLGTEHEQLQESGRGNSLSRTNLQLNLFEDNISEEKQKRKIEELEKSEPNIDENVAEVEITPANFMHKIEENVDNSPLILSQEEIDSILKEGGNIEHSKFRIYEHLRFPFNDEKASDYLKREYGIGGYTNSERWIEYSSKGITIRKNEKSLTLNWSSVAKRDLELIKNNEFLTPEEMKKYIKYEQDLRQDFAENFVDFCIDNDIYDWQKNSPDEENIESRKTREDHINDILTELNSKDDILAEISYLQNVKSSEDNNEHLIKSLDVFIEYFNIYYSKLTSKENEQIDLTTPEAKEFIGQAQKINDLFDAREQNEKPLNREEYYNTQNEADKNKTNNEKNKNIIKIDYHIPEKEIDFGTPKERYKNNIEAIKTLKQIESENRLADSQEQEILSKYVGWGGLADAFDENKWSAEYNELKNLLTENEYNAARTSTLTSFYTPQSVITAIYKAIENMGFEKGNILEPSCGIGNFFGGLPQELKESKLKMQILKFKDMKNQIYKIVSLM